MEYTITLQQIEHINHNVLRLVTDKPKHYTFAPGQATEMAIDKDELRHQKRPFTFTSLPDDDRLEFTIKVYPSHNGVTNKLKDLRVGDQLIIGDAWGAINYRGQGTFIAGGAGITPFIAILKDLNRKGELQNNRLFFSNKTEKDIIYKNNLEAWLGDHLYLILSDEDHKDYISGHVDATLLKAKGIDTSKPVYLCGPPAMEAAIKAGLHKLGISDRMIVTEG